MIDKDFIRDTKRKQQEFCRMHPAAQAQADRA